MTVNDALEREEFAKWLSTTAAYWKAQGRPTCELGDMPISTAERLAAALRGATTPAVPTAPEPNGSAQALVIVADALECFWNASIGAAKGSQDATALAVAGSLSEGFAAIAARLREAAGTITSNREAGQ